MWPPEIPLSEAKILASASPENGLPSPGSAALLSFLSEVMQESSVSGERKGKAAVVFVKHQTIRKIRKIWKLPY